MAKGKTASITLLGEKQCRQTFAKLARLMSERAVARVNQAALALQLGVRKAIAQKGRGIVYTISRGGQRVQHQASRPGDPPAQDLGTLAAHVGIERFHEGMTAEVGYRNYPPGVYLEFGTQHMDPRPVLFPTWDGKVRGEFLKGLTADVKQLEKDAR